MGDWAGTQVATELPGYVYLYEYTVQVYYRYGYAHTPCTGRLLNMFITIIISHYYA